MVPLSLCMLYEAVSRCEEPLKKSNMLTQCQACTLCIAHKCYVKVRALAQSFLQCTEMHCPSAVHSACIPKYGRPTPIEESSPCDPTIVQEAEAMPPNQTCRVIEAPV